jgi:hypothetical protein
MQKTLEGEVTMAGIDRDTMDIIRARIGGYHLGVVLVNQSIVSDTAW